MNLWGHGFSQNANQKISKQTRIFKTAYTHQKITKKSATIAILACLVGQKSGKILVCILGEAMTS